MVIEPVDYTSDSDTPFLSLRRSLEFIGATATLPECTCVLLSIRMFRLYTIRSYMLCMMVASSCVNVCMYGVVCILTMCSYSTYRIGTLTFISKHRLFHLCMYACIIM